ncbi:MAG: hypothetical protein Q9201_006661 [Fulgogasparrea decipioides]
MSANAVPISLDRFAEAIAELPTDNLHAKAAELRNSIAHLVSSNDQLRQYADDGDPDCVEAIKENEEVIGRMEARISLLRNEIESRGLPWGDEPTTLNGKLEEQWGNNQAHIGNGSSSTVEEDAAPQSARAPGGRLTDEELAARLRDQLNEDMPGGEDDDGVHL